MKGFNPPRLEQAVCARCATPFTYLRRTCPRMYCAPCLPLEKQDANRFFNTWAAVKRIEARRNAAWVPANA